VDADIEMRRGIRCIAVLRYTVGRFAGRKDGAVWRDSYEALLLVFFQRVKGFSDAKLNHLAGDISADV